MTETETARLLAVVAVAYQSFEVTRERVSLWHTMLGGIDYRLAERAVRQHIAQSKWPPTVAEILDAARETAFGPHMQAGEAWSLLIGAVRRYGYYRPEEAREKLPAMVLQAVEYLGGWRHVCMTENEDALRAHFMRMWDQLVQREQQGELGRLALAALPRTRELESGR